MGLDAIKLKEILIGRPLQNYDNDIRIIKSWIDYDTKKDKMNYMLIEYEIQNGDEILHLFKVIKMVRLIRLPDTLKQSTQLMAIHSQLLSSLWSNNTKFISIIARINNCEPDIPLGLIQIYGVQGIGTTFEEALQEAEDQFQGLIAALQGNYRTMEFRYLNMKEAEWLKEKMTSVKYLQVIRGIPNAKRASAERSIKGFGNTDTDASSEETSEQFAIGLADHDFIAVCIATPVAYDVLESWLTQVSKKQTQWISRMQGTTNMSAGINIPIVFAANLGATLGYSDGYSEGHSYSHGVNDSYSYGTNESLAHSTSISQGHSVSTGENLGHNFSHSVNDSVGTNDSYGRSEGTNTNISASDSYNTSNSIGYSQNHSNTTGTSTSIGENISHSTGVSTNEGYSLSKGTSESFNHSISQSHQISESAGQSKSYGTSVSDSTNYSTSHGSSYTHSKGNSTSFSQGISHGISKNTGYSYQEGYNSGWNVGGGASLFGAIKGDIGHSTGQSKGENWSYGTGVSDSTSQQHSVGTNESISKSISNSQSSGISHTKGYSESIALNYSKSVGSSQGYSEGYGISNQESVTKSTGISQSQSDSIGYNYSQNTSNSITDGTGISEQFSEGFGRSISKGWGQNVSDSESHGISQSVGRGKSEGINYGINKSESSNWSYSEGATYSKGISQSWSKGTSDSWGINTGRSFSTSNSLSQGISSSMGIGASIGISKSYSFLDVEIKNIVELLEFQVNRLKQAINGHVGAFYTDMYIGTFTREAREAARVASRFAWYDDKSPICPLQVLDIESEDEFIHMLQHFNAFSSCPKKEMDKYGQLESYKYSTILTSTELTAYTHPIRLSDGGLFADIQNIPELSVPAEMKGEIYMGKIVSGYKWSIETGYVTPYDYRIKNEALMHTLFAASSRSGKTVAALRYVAEIANNVIRERHGKRMRVIILDAKRDWRNLVQIVDKNRFRFYSMDNADFYPFNYNPLKIPLGVPAEFYSDIFVNIFCRAYGLGVRSLSLLTTAVKEAYEDAGVFATTDKYEITRRSAQVTFKQVYDKLQDIVKSTTGRDKIEALEKVLDRVVRYTWDNSIMHRLYSQPTGMSIDELLGADDIVVIESGAIQGNNMVFLFGMLTASLYIYAKYLPDNFNGEDQYETLLVIEEANKVLTGDSGDTENGIKGQSIFEEMMDQAAGLGLFVTAITQEPSKIPSSIIANCGITFAGKLRDEKDIDTIMTAIGKESRYDDRNIRKFFPKMPIGWFIVQTSRVYDYKEAEPVLIRVEPLKITQLSNTALDTILKSKELKV